MRPRRWEVLQRNAGRGQIGGGRTKTAGIVDVALLPTLARRASVEDSTANYGFVIVHECHHIAALDHGLTLTKARMLMGRRGVVASYRTLHRYATTELGFSQRKTTVRVADGEPGAELQVDFGRLGTALTSFEGVLT